MSNYTDALKANKLSPDEERDIINDVASENGLTGESRKLLHGIRHVENGRQGREFGVLNSKAEKYADDPDPEKSFRLQAGWAAAGIKKHFDGDIKKFAERYAPTQGATNDVHSLNKNWINNMTSYMQGVTNDGYGN